MDFFFPLAPLRVSLIQTPAVLTIRHTENCHLPFPGPAGSAAADSAVTTSGHDLGGPFL